MGAQCRSFPAEGCGVFCKRHFGQQGAKGWHGRVDGAIPEAKLKEFQERAARSASGAVSAPVAPAAGTLPEASPAAAPPEVFAQGGFEGAREAAASEGAGDAGAHCGASAPSVGGGGGATTRIVAGVVVRVGAGAGTASTEPPRPQARPRIATIGIPDVEAHEKAQQAREAETARRRREEGERGRVTDRTGVDLPRSDPHRLG